MQCRNSDNKFTKDINELGFIGRTQFGQSRGEFMARVGKKLNSGRVTWPIWLDLRVQKVKKRFCNDSYQSTERRPCLKPRCLGVVRAEVGIRDALVGVDFPLLVDYQVKTCRVHWKWETGAKDSFQDFSECPPLSSLHPIPFTSHPNLL